MLAFGAIAALVLAAPASGKSVNAPPGNSGIAQYLEVVPTASGNKPSVPLKASTATASGPATIAPVQSDASSVSQGDERTSESAVKSRDTRSELQRSGETGRQLLTFVDETSPSGGGRLADADAGQSRGASLLGTLTGGDGSTGLGGLLPGVLVALALIALIARRAPRWSGRRP